MQAKPFSNIASLELSKIDTREHEFLSPKASTLSRRRKHASIGNIQMKSNSYFMRDFMMDEQEQMIRQHKYVHAPTARTTDMYINCNLPFCQLKNYYLISRKKVRKEPADPNELSAQERAAYVEGSVDRIEQQKRMIVERFHKEIKDIARKRRVEELSAKKESHARIKEGIKRILEEAIEFSVKTSSIEKGTLSTDREVPKTTEERIREAKEHRLKQIRDKHLKKLELLQDYEQGRYKEVVDKIANARESMFLKTDEAKRNTDNVNRSKDESSRERNESGRSKTLDFADKVKEKSKFAHPRSKSPVEATPRTPRTPRANRGFKTSTPLLNILGIENYDEVEDIDKINVRIENAAKYQEKWKVVREEDFNKLLQFKIVQEVMQIEERKAIRSFAAGKREEEKKLQAEADLEKKMKLLIEKKTEEERKKKELQETERKTSERRDWEQKQKEQREKDKIEFAKRRKEQELKEKIEKEERSKLGILDQTNETNAKKSAKKSRPASQKKPTTQKKEIPKSRQEKFNKDLEEAKTPAIVPPIGKVSTPSNDVRTPVRSGRAELNAASIAKAKTEAMHEGIIVKDLKNVVIEKEVHSPVLRKHLMRISLTQKMLDATKDKMKMSREFYEDIARNATII